MLESIAYRLISKGFYLNFHSFRSEETSLLRGERGEGKGETVHDGGEEEGGERETEDSSRTSAAAAYFSASLYFSLSPFSPFLLFLLPLLPNDSVTPPWTTALLLCTRRHISW